MCQGGSSTGGRLWVTNWSWIFWAMQCHMVGRYGFVSNCIVALALDSECFLGYEVSLSRMLNDILKLEKVQWLCNRWDFTQVHDLDSKLDLYQITSGFHGAIATVVSCPQGTLAPLEPISPLLGLAYVLIVESSFPQTCRYSTGYPSNNRQWLDIAEDISDCLGGSLQCSVGKKQYNLGTGAISCSNPHSARCRNCHVKISKNFIWLLYTELAATNTCKGQSYLQLQCTKSKSAVSNYVRILRKIEYN